MPVLRSPNRHADVSSLGSCFQGIQERFDKISFTDLCAGHHCRTGRGRLQFQRNSPLIGLVTEHPGYIFGDLRNVATIAALRIAARPGG